MGGAEVIAAILGGRRPGAVVKVDVRPTRGRVVLLVPLEDDALPGRVGDHALAVVGVDRRHERAVAKTIHLAVVGVDADDEGAVDGELGHILGVGDVLAHGGGEHAAVVPLELLDLVDVLVPNQTELSLLAGTGPINSVNEAIEAAKGLAERINANAPLAVRATRKAVRDGALVSDEEGIRIAGELFCPVASSEDAKEGPLAFVEKRPPEWKAR